MFKTRLISGIILVIIALATIISGSWILFFTLLAVSLIGMRELYKVMKVSDEPVSYTHLGDMTGKIFRLGQKVRVRVADADKMLKTVDFVLAEED